MLESQLQRLNVFIDESGTSKEERLFSCVAVLVDDTQMEPARAAVEAVAQLHASGGEIKSSSIGANHARRLQFLQAIQSIDFQYACLVADKHAIADNSGLRFRKSFNKFFKRLLQQPLDTYASGGVRAVFDNYGWPATMKEFERYMSDRIPRSLFFDYQPTHVDSKSERLVQLADLIAGSLLWCYDPNRNCSLSQQFRDLLRTKQHSITAWPPREYIEEEGDDSQDPTIAHQAQFRARRLISKYEASSTPEERAISIILEELLFARMFEEGTSQSIYADRLPVVLGQHGIEMSKRQVQSLIGVIRDAGVVVAGSPNGYKLALTAADINEYLVHTVGIVGPMLARVTRARESVKLDTRGQYDILSASPRLSRLVEAATEGSLVALEKDLAGADADEVLEEGA